MAKPQVRLDNDVAAKAAKSAKRNKRCLSGEVNFILAEFFDQKESAKGTIEAARTKISRLLR